MLNLEQQAFIDDFKGFITTLGMWHWSKTFTKAQLYINILEAYEPKRKRLKVSKKKLTNLMDKYIDMERLHKKSFFKRLWRKLC